MNLNDSDIHANINASFMNLNDTNVKSIARDVNLNGRSGILNDNMRCKAVLCQIE